jgi:hypothetical protein
MQKKKKNLAYQFFGSKHYYITSIFLSNITVTLYNVSVNRKHNRLIQNLNKNGKPK